MDHLATVEYVDSSEIAGHHVVTFFYTTSPTADTNARWLSMDGSAPTTAREHKIRLHKACTASSLHVDGFGAAAAGGTGFNFTVRKNGADTAITCQVAAGGTAASDTAHTVAFAANDQISVQMQGVGAVSTAPGHVICSINIDY